MTERSSRSERLLLVCTGNQCRSPMAEVLLRAEGARRGVAAEVSSAGLLRPGVPASQHAVEVLRNRGLDLSGHRSRRLGQGIVAAADLVVSMARGHVREVVALEPGAWPRTFTLKQIVRRGEQVGRRSASETLADWVARLHEGRSATTLLGEADADDVADPIGQPRPAYEATAAELADLMARLASLLWDADRPVDDRPVESRDQAEPLPYGEPVAEDATGGARDMRLEEGEDVLRQAHTEADRLRSDAEAEASQLRQEAHAAASRVRAEAQDLAGELLSQAGAEASEARAEAERVLADAADEAERLLTEAGEEVEHLRSEARQAADRAAAERWALAERLQQEMLDEATEEVERLLEHADAAAAETRAQAEEVVAQARAEAEEVVAQARAEAEEVVAQARAEAEQVVAEARAEGERIREGGREDAEQAAAAVREEAERAAAALRAGAAAHYTARLHAADEEAAAIRQRAAAEADAIAEERKRELAHEEEAARQRLAEVPASLQRLRDALDLVPDVVSHIGPALADAAASLDDVGVEPGEPQERRRPLQGSRTPGAGRPHPVTGVEREAVSGRLRRFVESLRSR